MFHVSTLLPYVKDSKQQLERKRHIGNDIVTIVFQDLEDNEEPDFTPSSARSQFQHIFALVVHNKKDNSYRLRIFSEQSVPPFGPSLPNPPHFTNHKEFREFLLVKLINGEKSAFNNSVFGKRRKRTIEAIITSLHSTYEKENFKVNSNLISGGIGEAISDALISGNIRTRKKEEIRKAEFLRIGQNLKLQTILKGDAPTSQITTGAVKKELWEPQIFLQTFESIPICSDSWNNLLVLATNNGIFVIDEAIPWETKEIFDKSVQARQLDVCESYGFLILLIDKGRICIFKLSEFSQIMSDSNWDQAQVKTKIHCKEHKLDLVNGCHLYAISKQIISTQDENAVSTSNTFRIAAACGKKIILIQLKSTQNSSICHNCSTNSLASSNIPDSTSNEKILTSAGSDTSLATADISSLFQIKKEITCSDVPQLINIVDSNSSLGENYILVGYKNKIELISERTGECLKNFQFNPLSTIRSMLELYDKDKLEILVTYNYTSEFIKLDEYSINSTAPPATQQQQSNTVNNNNNTNQTSPQSKTGSFFSFQWNSEPNFVLCIFPYVIGFASQCIEIRLLVNGNLVNSITMSNIQIAASKREIIFSADHELFITKEFANSFNDRHLNSFVINVTNSNPISSNVESPPLSPTQEKESKEPSFFSFANNMPTNHSNANSQTKPCSTIYRINLDFLKQANSKSNEKFNQLCENSTRIIQREICNTSSQFLFTECPDELTNKYSSIYQKIISSNKDENSTETNDKKSESANSSPSEAILSPDSTKP